MTQAARDALLTVLATDGDVRLDRFLAARIQDLSRSQAQRLIRAGLVTVDGKPVKSSLAMAPGMTVAVTIPAATAAEPASEAIPLSILYDDEDVVVVDKPAGMVVHPAAGHASGTLVNALLHHVRGLSGIGGQERPGIVHRLDKGTSGVMVIAKHDRAHRALSQQFHDRVVQKEYLALVWGDPQAEQRFERPIGRDPHHRQRMSSRGPRTRSAHTVVMSAEPLGGVSLVRVRIHTGRTHQIRVHLSEAGHPVVGDALYGGVRTRIQPRLAAVKRIDRPFLHSARLTFAHPADGRPITVEAPLPRDLSDVVEVLRRTSTRPSTADTEDDA